jgi:glycosyltransferase involved in cell wall biosynthesis
LYQSGSEPPGPYPMKISATIISFNEESNIEACLRSLWFADEIVLVDSESTDRTVEIARRFTDRVFVRPWPGYSEQKNFAAEQARFDWILNLDADERVSEELSQEILGLKNREEPEAAGFEMPRRTFYLGRWIKHSGWYPDFKLRMYRRDRAGWQPRLVHESIVAEGRVERLTGTILHYTVRDASEHHLRIDRYTTLAALEEYSRAKRASLMSLLILPAVTFVRSYIFKLGFLDGIQGLAIARFAAQYVFLKNLKMWEMGSDPQAARGEIRK